MSAVSQIGAHEALDPQDLEACDRRLINELLEFISLDIRQLCNSQLNDRVKEILWAMLVRTTAAFGLPADFTPEVMQVLSGEGWRKAENRRSYVQTAALRMRRRLGYGGEAMKVEALEAEPRDDRDPIRDLEMKSDLETVLRLLKVPEPLKNYIGLRLEALQNGQCPPENYDFNRALTATRPAGRDLRNALLECFGIPLREPKV